jgi:hypothetical protein
VTGWVVALLATVSPLVEQCLPLVGKTFDQVVRGTEFDPQRRLTGAAKEAFRDTLNGPQAPGIIISRGGRNLLVYESCTRHLCAFYHSVTALDIATGELYAAVYGDTGKVVVVPEPLIERLIGNTCDGTFDDAEIIRK